MTGKLARHVPISDEEFKENRLKKELGLKEEPANEISTLLEFFRFSNGEWVDIAKTKEVYSQLHTWEDFVKETKWE